MEAPQRLRSCITCRFEESLPAAANAESTEKVSLGSCIQRIQLFAQRIVEISNNAQTANKWNTSGGDFSEDDGIWEHKMVPLMAILVRI